MFRPVLNSAALLPQPQLQTRQDKPRPPCQGRGSFCDEKPDAGLLRYLGPSCRLATSSSADLSGSGTGGDYSHYMAQLRVPQFGGRKLIREVLRSLDGRHHHQQHPHHYWHQSSSEHRSS